VSTPILTPQEIAAILRGENTADGLEVEARLLATIEAQRQWIGVLERENKRLRNRLRMSAHSPVSIQRSH